MAKETAKQRIDDRAKRLVRQGLGCTNLPETLVPMLETARDFCVAIGQSTLDVATIVAIVSIHDRKWPPVDWEAVEAGRSLQVLWKGVHHAATFAGAVPGTRPAKIRVTIDEDGEARGEQEIWGRDAQLMDGLKDGRAGSDR